MSPKAYTHGIAVLTWGIGASVTLVWMVETIEEAYILHELLWLRI